MTLAQDVARRVREHTIPGASREALDGVTGGAATPFAIIVQQKDQLPFRLLKDA
jgi:hypothetical protein